MYFLNVTTECRTFTLSWANSSTNSEYDGKYTPVSQNFEQHLYDLIILRFTRYLTNFYLVWWIKTKPYSTSNSTHNEILTNFANETLKIISNINASCPYRIDCIFSI